MASAPQTLSPSREDREEKTKKRPKKKSAPTLSEAVRDFYTHIGPVLITIASIAAISFRIYLGDWSWWDLLIAGSILAFWPIQEWLIHVFILHFKPRKIGNITIDPFVANKHRRHHAEPWDIELAFAPMRGIILVLVLNLVLWFGLMPSKAMAMSGIGTYVLLGLLYEWTHFLIHTRYRPKGKFYKRLWQNHRLHHCKNENYWYGVSMTMGDTLLGTAPDQKTVETSDTCKTVHPQV